MNIKSFLTSAVLLGIILFTHPIASYAQTICTPIYGGGQTCVTTGEFSVDKKILNPITNNYVDNLGVNDARFKPGDIVNFQIDIINNGDALLRTIDIKDTFPQYLNFESGPGSFNANTKILTFNLSNLASKEKRTFKIAGKVADANQITLTNGFVCVVNQVQAVNPADTKQTSQDNTQFCIEKNGEIKGGFPVVSPVPVYQTPPTGGESLILFSLLPTGLAGWLLRKISIKNHK